MFGDVSMNYDYVNVSSFRLLSRCFARTRCTLCAWPVAVGRSEIADRVTCCMWDVHRHTPRLLTRLCCLNGH
jgi:hypothetical protein